MGSVTMAARVASSARVHRAHLRRGTEGSNPAPSSRQSGLSPEFACHRREAALFRQCCGPEQPERSAETGMTRRYGANGR